MKKKRIGIGKGLDFNLGEVGEAFQKKELANIDVEQVIPNRYQPRQVFDSEALQSLSLSLKQHGVIQPIIVRKNGDQKFELVSGERRWRAAKIAGIDQIPAIVKEIDDQVLMEWAVIENLQREDLNPIEKAQAYEKLISEFSFTQEMIANRMGLDRSSVSNFLRLLQLPTALWREISKGSLTMGHAKVLLSLKNKEHQLGLAERIKKRRLSVRQAEVEMHRLNNPPSKKTRTPMIPELKLFENKLQTALGTNVKFVQQSQGCELRISLKSEDDLERIMNSFLDK
ncbi:MAG: ParB/RepB/Spo0J family partition protein [bacterium]